MVRFNARLSAQAAALVEAHAEAAQVPAWKILDTLIMTGLSEVPPEPLPALPPLALELAKNAAAFLARHDSDPRAASRILRKAWERALLLASHDMESKVAPHA